jgi:acyl-CoA carboxylase epsilon subunit-like protein
MSLAPETPVEAPAPPAFSITHGVPTAEELAALTVVLAVVTSAGPDEAKPKSGWTSRRRTFQIEAVPGSGWGAV